MSIRTLIIGNRVLSVVSALCIPINYLDGGWWIIPLNLVVIACSVPSWRASA